VGHPGPPNLAVMSEDEIEERRATVAKLRDLADRAQDGDQEAALDIRRTPLSWSVCWPRGWWPLGCRCSSSRSSMRLG
jgi:hypothetical protein